MPSSIDSYLFCSISLCEYTKKSVCFLSSEFNKLCVLSQVDSYSFIHFILTEKEVILLEVQILTEGVFNVFLGKIWQIHIVQAHAPPLSCQLSFSSKRSSVLWVFCWKCKISKNCTKPHNSVRLALKRSWHIEAYR